MKIITLFAALFVVFSVPGCTDDDGNTDHGGADVPVDVPADTAAEVPADVPPDVPAEVAADTPPADTGEWTCDPPAETGSLYELSALDKDFEEVSMCRYRGQVALIVNVAALCGYTPQFAGLQTLYDRYRDQGFVVLGFYCDQFAHQAGSPDECAIVEDRYHVTFPLFDILNVNPPGEHPIYTWLKAQPGGAGAIGWNFEKFLVSRDGRLLDRWVTTVSPTAPEITSAIEAALAAP